MTKNDAKEFSRKVELFAANNKMSIVEAIIEHCERDRIEPEYAAKMITPKLKKRIRIQALDRNQLKVKKQRGLI